LTLLNRAIELATLAHGKINQVRNGSGKPYIEHPIRVANTIVSIVDNRVTENTIAAAYLHDVLEDTPTTEEEILAATNDHVLQLVKELTNPSKNFVFKQEYKKLPKGSVRAMKKQMDRDHIKTVSWEAKLIKLADRIDNVNDMEGMDKDFCLLYADESMALLEVLSETYEPLEIKLKDAIMNLKGRFIDIIYT
jgi:(p)ppGpp synthase/HD superfamily hydrolase